MKQSHHWNYIDDIDMASKIPDLDEIIDDLAELGELNLDTDMKSFERGIDMPHRNDVYAPLADVHLPRDNYTTPYSNTGQHKRALVSAEVEGENDCEDLFDQDKEGDSKLHVAVIVMNVNLVRYLISIAPSKEWLSLQNDMFQTALHLAVLTVQPEVVRMLLVKGCDVTLRDKDGNSALSLACWNGNIDIVNLILDHIRILRTKRRDYQNLLDGPDYDGRTCLQIAATHGRMDIVKVLLSNGADINSVNPKSGRTVLHTACDDGQLSVVRYFLNKPDCDINAKAYDGSTPFDLARAKGHGEVTLALAVAGVKYCEDVEL